MVNLQYSKMLCNFIRNNNNNSPTLRIIANDTRIGFKAKYKSDINQLKGNRIGPFYYLSFSFIMNIIMIFFELFVDGQTCFVAFIKNHQRQQTQDFKSLKKLNFVLNSNMIY